MNIPNIEIYTTNMMLEFLHKGLVNPASPNELYIFNSSYETRLEELRNNWNFNHAVFFLYQQNESEYNPMPFTHDMAQMVTKSLNERNFKIIYVVCDDGQTRSAGMTAALYRYYGFNELRIWNSPYLELNLSVYEKMCQQLGNFDYGDMRLKKFRNEEVLINTIKEGTNINRSLFRYGLNSRVSEEKKDKYLSELTRLNNYVIEKELHVFSQDADASPLDGTMVLLQEVIINSLEFLWRYDLLKQMK